MSWRYSKANVFARLSVLGTMCCLGACQPMALTPTVAIDTRTAEQVCSVWKAVSYSSKDTSQTQLEVRANNAAREAYCR